MLLDTRNFSSKLRFLFVYQKQGRTETGTSVKGGEGGYRSLPDFRSGERREAENFSTICSSSFPPLPFSTLHAKVFTRAFSSFSERPPPISQSAFQQLDY